MSSYTIARELQRLFHLPPTAVPPLIRIYDDLRRELPPLGMPEYGQLHDRYISRLERIQLKYVDLDAICRIMSGVYSSRAARHAELRGEL